MDEEENNINLKLKLENEFSKKKMQLMKTTNDIFKRFQTRQLLGLSVESFNSNVYLSPVSTSSTLPAGVQLTCINNNLDNMELRLVNH